MELIQNAEDNEYQEDDDPTLEFVLTKRDITGTGAPATLLVFNNEIGFSKKNMESVCSVGRSTKKGKRKLGYIGEKGIGFKSVFLVSAQPHIYSNGYCVKFSEYPDKDCGIGYIVPEWVGGKISVSSIHDVYGSTADLPRTAIILPIKLEKVAAVEEQLSQLHPEILLFLLKIRRLKVRGIGHDTAISIANETHHFELRDERADSRVVKLSVKENTEETCDYFLWKQIFPVRPQNKVGSRMDVEEWVVTLAFPYGARLKRATTSVGVFSFLPTAMVTNFPFVIQADFILASSRETILLDNKWNLGILDCVPSAFLAAFKTCLNEKPSKFSVAQVFDFLPVGASAILELNKIRSSIRNLLGDLNFVPCESFTSEISFCQPSRTVRISPQFRGLLTNMKRNGVPLSNLSSLKKKVLHHSLDIEKYSPTLKFLGVESVQHSFYAECILSCNLALVVTEDLYIELLLFISEFQNYAAIRNLPVLRYINQDGKLGVCGFPLYTDQPLNILYAANERLHVWLNKWNMEMGCPGKNFLLPNPTQRALECHNKGMFLRNWLSCCAGVRCCSAYDYAYRIINLYSSKKITVRKPAITLAHFLYHSHQLKFIEDHRIGILCKAIPVLDGSNCLKTERHKTLVPAPTSQWFNLFGSRNAFIEEKYVDLSVVYARSNCLTGGCTSNKELLIFLNKYSEAVDLGGMYPSNAALQVASSALTYDRAILLLSWVRSIRRNYANLPENFVQSIRVGKWLKTNSGFSSPSQSIIRDEMGNIMFDMMKNFLEDISVVDQEYYQNQISAYTDELNFLGAKVRFDDVQSLVIERCKLYSSSVMRKDQVISLLMFVGYLKAISKLDEDWLKALKTGKWLRTSQGCNEPTGSVLLPSDFEADAVSEITNIAVIDEGFYGSKIASFTSELMLLGVVTNVEDVYKLILENVSLPQNPSLMTNNSGLLLLKCIQYMGSTLNGLVDKIKSQPWLKTHSGMRCPSESVLLLKPEWRKILSSVEVAVIDESFYGDSLRYFKDELKAVGVATDLNSAWKIMVTQLKSHVSSSSLTAANVICLLDGIREISSELPELSSSLSTLKWLKTRHGYKIPCESILFDAKWGSISLFVDLPLIDDSFYGINIYGYAEELSLVGVITNFSQGFDYVARGLGQLVDHKLVSATGSISLLECMQFIMLKSDDPSLYAAYFDILKTSKWLKTNSCYSRPEKCVLFDPLWEGILDRNDAPIIDESFYGREITRYKDQLRAIGVKVDASDVCSLLYGTLFAQGDTNLITRIYRFLNIFKYKPGDVDASSFQVWIPSVNDTIEGEWVSSSRCLLRDRNNLFGFSFHSLHNFYDEELLPLFSSIFGVAEFPSIDEYLKLWNRWSLRETRRLSEVECLSFWGYVINNWNSATEEKVKQNLTKLPATTSSDKEIFLMSTDNVFIPDDSNLKMVFSGEHPLFVWCPKSSSSSTISRSRLYQIYGCLGVKSISSSVTSCSSNIPSSYDSLSVVPREGLLTKGFMKIILGVLAGLKTYTEFKKRHKALRTLLDLTIYELEKPIEVCYRLMSPSGFRLEVIKRKMVLWKKNCGQLLIDESGFENQRSRVEFVCCFAQEIAEGLLLPDERPKSVKKLSKILQLGFLLDFENDAVDFLLTQENIELLKEDEKFLHTALISSNESNPYIRKRKFAKLELVGPSTPTDPSKNRCKNR